MALQTQNLVMIGLGTQGDTPTNAVQPPLVDAVHLRWTFRRDLGFPWYGFYLFRRPHQQGDPTCLSRALQQVPPGNWASTSFVTPLGTLSSDQNLVLTDDFPPNGQAEFDLAGRRYLRFDLPPGEMARWMQVRVGFREEGGGEGERECIPFLQRQAGSGANPRAEQGVTFTVYDHTGAPYPQSRIAVANTTVGPLSGLDCGRDLEITLPHPSPFVELLLTHFAAPAEIAALNDDGSLAGSVQMQNPSRTPERIRLTGRSITRVVVKPPQSETLLHELCFGRVEHPDRLAPAQILVAALLGNTPVVQEVLSERPGQIATAVLEFDAISSLELSAGPCALVDICYIPVSQNVSQGWGPVPGFWYPLCLPITHPDYPCSGNAPVDPGAAEARALGRVVYGPPGDWAGAPFTDLHTQLINLVVGGPGSAPMASRTSPPIVATPVPPDPGLTPPTMPQQSPLDLVLLGALHPAVAQMVGLYWADRSAPPGVPFDYLIVGDYTGLGGRDPNKVLSRIQANGFADFEGYIVFNKQMQPATALLPPTDVRAYALPGATRHAQGGGLQDGSNNAGLRWDLGVTGLGILLPEYAVMYHVWRAGLGDADMPAAPATYNLITSGGATLVGEPPPGLSPQRSLEWPPFPLHYLDTGLRDGWYGYQVSGVDIFGRHSSNSAAARWYEWTPVPDPRPWYYQDPPGDRPIHPSAVRLLDKLPPPAPTGIEAFALDPADPTVLKDPAYDAWWETLSAAEQNTVIGLRVRWQWTSAHIRQAPDTREFRIYYHPGQVNTLLGRMANVTASSSTESMVTTDIANVQPANAYVGAWLRTGANNFPVVGSDAGTPLRLRVRNLGLTYTTGTVSVSNGSATVTGAGTAWHAGMVGLAWQIAGDAEPYLILSVQSATQLTLSRVYAGATNMGQAYTIFATRPKPNTACSVAILASYGEGTVSVTNGSPLVTGTGTNWNANLAGQTLRVEGELTPFRIQAVNSVTQLTLAQNYAGATASGKIYAISHPLFVDFTVPTNWDERYYVVGYNEHVTVTNDSAGRPLRIYEVLLPAQGDAYRNGVPLTTTLAEPIAYAHVSVSAADDKGHTDDDPKWAPGRWGNRPGNEGQAGPPAMIFRVRRQPPPTPAPPPDSERVFATPADYHSRSFYTYRWTPSANLKTHIFRALDEAIFKADWAQRPRPTLDETQLQFFPNAAVEPRWDALKRTQVANELNQLNGFSHDANGTAQAMRIYRGLSNDALRVLAGLPNNERAFTQLTIQPLDPDHPANANRVGPDNPPTFIVDAGLRAYIDTLDGRSANRYFYRAAYVDGAHNRGPLSLSSPPVWLPNIVPPHTPTLTKILGGDRQITLHWASNREADLTEYRVYRANRAEFIRDLRLMTLVHTEAVAAGNPATRPAEVSWTDQPVVPFQTFFYRVTAVDEAGNQSNPSAAVQGRAYREGLPDAPVWVSGIRQVVDGASIVRLIWTLSENLSVLIQRQSQRASRWNTLGTWLPTGTTSFDDGTADPAVQYFYRLRGRDSVGAQSDPSDILDVPPA